MVVYELQFMRPEPGILYQLLIEAPDILVARVSPSDVVAEPGGVESITHERVVRRRHSVKLRPGDGIEGLEIANIQQIDSLELTIGAGVAEKPLSRFRTKHRAIARGLEILAEPLVGEKPETLITPVISRRA